jgi:hypothetical protein
MGLRLRRWWHRDPVPTGRHVRTLPVMSVPGAASTLVSRTPPQVLAAEAHGAADDDVPHVPAPSSSVGLVFADGGHVELDADDPRIRTFQAAASALLDKPSA